MNRWSWSRVHQEPGRPKTEVNRVYKRSKSSHLTLKTNPNLSWRTCEGDGDRFPRFSTRRENFPRISTVSMYSHSIRPREIGKIFNVMPQKAEQNSVLAPPPSIKVGRVPFRGENSEFTASSLSLHFSPRVPYRGQIGCQCQLSMDIVEVTVAGRVPV